MPLGASALTHALCGGMLIVCLRAVAVDTPCAAVAVVAHCARCIAGAVRCCCGLLCAFCVHPCSIPSRGSQVCVPPSFSRLPSPSGVNCVPLCPSFVWASFGRWALLCLPSTRPVLLSLGVWQFCKERRACICKVKFSLENPFQGSPLLMQRARLSLAVFAAEGLG